MSQNNYAQRLREMAEFEKEHAQRNAKWFMEEEIAGKYASANAYAMISARQGLNVQALLAGAEALERNEEAKAILRQIASGQSWNPQRDAEEALANMEAL